MRKNIHSVFYIPLPLLALILSASLALILSAPAAYAADNAPSGVIQAGNRAYQDGALSFDAELSGDSVRGQFAVAVFTESGQFRNGSFYPAASAVHVRLGDVGGADVVKAMWLDDNFCPLAEAAILRMKEYGAEAFAQFTRKLGELYDELDASGGAEAADPSNPYALSRLIVSCDALPDLTRFEPTAVVPGPDGLYILQFRLPSKARSCAEYLQSLPSVRYAEPDSVIESDFTEETADLAELSASSVHYSWGAAATGLDRYAENLLQRGLRRSVTVAVVDSGVDFEHPLLKDRLLSGYDFIERDVIPQDELGHGTHVAGIVADCVTGADVKILPVRVMDGFGAMTTLGVYQGIRYAAEQGANIINLSLSSPALYGAIIDDAVQYAVSKNITVVAAAGNQNDDTAKRSPAHLKTCVTVAGVNANGARFPLSNFGDAVDLAAPAKEVLSAVPTGSGVGYPDKNYDYMSGTSMAAPHVSSAAALLMTERGTGQSPAQISSILRRAAKDLGSKGWDKYFGAGLLNLTSLIHPVISFHANGGSGEMSAQIVGYRTATVLSANAFIRAGYRFAGWNTASDGSGEPYADGTSVTLDDSVTLYAQWTPLNGIYAILYGDGELVFQNSVTAAPGRTVSKTYVISATDGSAEYAAWYNQRNAVRKVNFAEKIKPASTALWFYDCANLTEISGLENLDASGVTDMSQMFFGCAKLETIYASDKFTANAGASGEDMFDGCVSLIGGAGTKYDAAHTGKEYASIDGGANNPGYFTDKNAPVASIYAVLYTDDEGNGELVFQNNNRTESGRNVMDVYKVAGNNTPWNEQRDKIITVRFADFIQPDSVENWFSYCRKLTKILNIENLNTSRLTDMSHMFQECNSLTGLDVSGFDTSHVIGMTQMFDGCGKLASLDVSGWDTSNVTRMNVMFRGCSSLTSLDASNWNISNVFFMNLMFDGCSGLTNLDITGWNTANVGNMYHMFYGCGALKQIYASSLFAPDNVSNSDLMFYGCVSLVGGNGTKYDAAHTGKEYARIDGGASAPGYFTDKDAPVLSNGIYAVLYADGELVFQNNNRTESGRSVTDVYWVDESYSWDDRLQIASTPWYEQRENIETVTFADKIYPTSTAVWFCNCAKLMDIQNIENLDTSKVSDMETMFMKCNNL